MNKIMLYVGLAILLGTVTMVVPLALLEPRDSIMDIKDTPTVPEYTVTVPEVEEPNNLEDFGEDRILENGNFSVQMTTPEPAPETLAPSEPSAAPEVPPQEPELVVKTAENPSDLSPIGLMTVPSFLVALGVFVYLRKRMS